MKYVTGVGLLLARAPPLLTLPLPSSAMSAFSSAKSEVNRLRTLAKSFFESVSDGVVGAA